MLRRLLPSLLVLLLVACNPTDDPVGPDPGTDPPVEDPIDDPGDDPNDDPTDDPRPRYWIAPDGDDTSGDGSATAPWATLDHAMGAVPAAGGFEVVLRDGIYDGSTAIERGFDAEVVVRAENAYGATLRHLTDNATVLYVAHQGAVNLVFEGMVFSNEGSTQNPCSFASGHLIHLTNVTHVTFRNNLVLGNDRLPRCNETIKINLDNAWNFPEEIRFEQNFFTTPPAVDGREMIDVFEPGELAIVGNLFVSDRASTGGEGFVHLWGEWGTPPRGEPRYEIARNVFMNYQGTDAKGFVVFGGEGTDLHEISDARIENNLFVDSSRTPMLAPLVMEGVRGIEVRANTFVGDFDAEGFVVALGAAGNNPASSELSLTDNLCWDPFGTMSQLATVTGDVDPSSITFDGNQVWNEGAAIPFDGPLGAPQDDGLDSADPQLPADPTGVAPPRWNAAQRRFESGSTTVAEEIERIVRAYAAIAAGSPARDAADPGRMPAVDILGLPRDGAPDTGAFEVR